MSNKRKSSDSDSDFHISSDTSESEGNEEKDLVDDNVMSLIIASDINLGYEQTIKRDQEEDSFITFEEILKYAKDEKVDAIILAGNLFYQANPPLNVIQRCISLLRNYCLSETPDVKINCISDPKLVFSHCDHKTVNFKDPSLNIGIPVFSICGNRDKPVFSRGGPLDLLATTGLVNYFGKWSRNDENDIEVAPLGLRKGLTVLALYGIDHTHEGELSKLLKDETMEFLGARYKLELFNLLVLNEKRARKNRPENSYVSESLLPDMFNVVVWGGEPVCHVEYHQVPDKPFHITQPGSSVITSLTQSEAKQKKKIALMHVYKDSFQMTYFDLKTVRPFIFDKIDLGRVSNKIIKLQQNAERGILKKSRAQAIEEYIDKRIEKELLPQSMSQRYSGHPRQPLKPLMRFKILYSNEDDRFDTYRLAIKYKDRVANPRDMIKFSNSSLLTCNVDSDEEDDELYNIFFKDESKTWTRTVEKGISEHYSKESNRKKMKVLSAENLTKALNSFQNNDEKAFDRVIRRDMQKKVNYLLNNKVRVENALEALENYKR